MQCFSIRLSRQVYEALRCGLGFKYSMVHAFSQELCWMLSIHTSIRTGAVTIFFIMSCIPMVAESSR